MLHEHCCSTNLHHKWLMQIPLGGTFKDPGCFAITSAPGKSSPATVSASVEGITSPAVAATCFVYISQQCQPSVHTMFRVTALLPFMLTRTLQFCGAANNDSVYGRRRSDNPDNCSNDHSILHTVHGHRCIGKQRNTSCPLCECVRPVPPRALLLRHRFVTAHHKACHHSSNELHSEHSFPVLPQLNADVLSAYFSVKTFCFLSCLHSAHTLSMHQFVLGALSMSGALPMCMPACRSV